MNEENPDKESTQLDQAREKAKGLIQLLFGFTYEKYEYLDKGATALGGKFERTHWVLRTFRNVKSYKKLALIKLLQNERAGEYLRKSFLLITNMA